MYKILFIDEEKDTLEDFEEFVEKFQSKVKLQPMTTFPLADLEEMIESIIKISPDALIADYRLNELKTDIKYNVPYNGVDLVEEFQSIRNLFPCFVLTALDDEAVNNSNDVNIVYVKNILYNKEEGNAKAKFLDRVISQIEHYRARIESAEQELAKLTELRRKGEANYEDEQHIIELDNFLEKTIDKRGSVPDDFKESSNTEKLGQLLNKVDELLNKLENKDNE
jgi:hypothetical protein